MLDAWIASNSIYVSLQKSLEEFNKQKLRAEVMILGAEIGLFVYGIVAMIRRKFSMGKKGNVTGWRAVVLGAMCAVILPCILIVGFTAGAAFALQGIEVSPMSFVWIDIFGLFFGYLSAIMLGKVFLAQQVSEATKIVSEPIENLQVATFDSSNPSAPTQMTPKSH